MKEKIIETLREHPGLRLREIAMYLRCNRFKVLDALNELYNEHIVASITVNNLVQGEYYAEYYLAEDAPTMKYIYTGPEILD